MAFTVVCPFLHPVIIRTGYSNAYSNRNTSTTSFILTNPFVKRDLIALRILILSGSHKQNPFYELIDTIFNISNTYVKLKRSCFYIPIPNMRTEFDLNPPTSEYELQITHTHLSVRCN